MQRQSLYLRAICLCAAVIFSAAVFASDLGGERVDLVAATAEPTLFTAPVINPAPLLLEEPEIPVEETAPATPEPAPKPYTSEEVTVLAKMVWGEARGIRSDMEKAACVWCVLNRLDAGNFGSSIIEVTTAPGQFAGYAAGNPVTEELYDLCEDVLVRYFAEKSGETDAGRVLPSEYLFFHGDGVRNYFRDAFKGGNVYDWSLDNPYQS